MILLNQFEKKNDTLLFLKTDLPCDLCENNLIYPRKYLRAERIGLAYARATLRQGCHPHWVLSQELYLVSEMDDV